LSDNDLRRIAEALERLTPPLREPVNLTEHAAYHWDGKALAGIQHFAPLPLDLISGVDRQKNAVFENLHRHAKGYAAHDVLLWGARGMGKSALVKSAIGALQTADLTTGLVEANAAHLDCLPALFSLLADEKRRYILFIDDIGFDRGGSEARMLRSMLEGGAEARPDNIRLVVTSNRRNIVERMLSISAMKPTMRWH